MSTRVQKGGVVFKPVAKPRARPPGSSSRQTSTVPTEHRATPTNATNNLDSCSTAPVEIEPMMLPLQNMAIPTSEEPAAFAKPAHVIPSFTSSRYAQRQSTSISERTPALANSDALKFKRGPSGSLPSKQVPSPLESTSTLNIESSSTAERMNTASTDHNKIDAPAGIFLPDTPFISWPVSVPSESGPRRVSLNTENTVKQPRRTSARARATGSTAPSNDDNQRAEGTDSVAKGENGSQTQELVALSGEMSTRRSTRQKRSLSQKAYDEATHTSSSAEPRKVRRRRASSLPSFEVTADYGADLDETAVTMGALCKDTGQGRVSSRAAQILRNHAAWKAANRERRAKMKGLMETGKYGKTEVEADSGRMTEPISTALGTIGSQDTDVLPPGNDAPSDVVLPTHDGSGHDFDYSQPLSTSRFNAQVRLGPNGETIVDEESLVVDRHQENNTDGYTHVEESDMTKFVNSATYGKKFRGSRWTAEETERFYDALSQFGENYELISYVLPGRDRTACKNKFKSEDRRNPNRINYCLNNRIPYDIQTLSRMTGKDFSGPTPVIRAPPPPPTLQAGLAEAPPVIKEKEVTPADIET